MANETTVGLKANLDDLQQSLASFKDEIYESAQNEDNWGFENSFLNNSKIEKEVQKEVIDLCSSFPIYSD